MRHRSPVALSCTRRFNLFRLLVPYRYFFLGADRSLAQACSTERKYAFHAIRASTCTTQRGRFPNAWRTSVLVRMAPGPTVVSVRWIVAKIAPCATKGSISSPKAIGAAAPQTGVRASTVRVQQAPTVPPTGPSFARAASLGNTATPSLVMHRSTRGHARERAALGSRAGHQGPMPRHRFGCR